MNLADAIRKASGQGGGFEPEVAPATPPAQEEEEVLDPLGMFGAGPGVTPPSNAVLSGNVVRLELFLTPEQMGGMLKAILVGQHSIMTLREAAGYLRVNPGALEKLAEEGEVPAVNIEGRWRFPKAQLDEWMAGRRTGTEVADEAA